MKNVLIRFMTLVLMSASLTSFAGAKSKHHDANSSAAAQQSGCASTAQEGKKQKKDSKATDRSEQEQEFDRVLMGIYG